MALMLGHHSAPPRSWRAEEHRSTAVACHVELRPSRGALSASLACSAAAWDGAPACALPRASSSVPQLQQQRRRRGDRRSGMVAVAASGGETDTSASVLSPSSNSSSSTTTTATMIQQQLEQQQAQGEVVEGMPECAQEKFWHWTLPSGLQARIRYFQAGDKGPCLLLLHGFGVGAYHWERNIKELSQSCRVFAVDVLGQGSSWPVRPATPEDGLYISIDTWLMQLHDFTQQVMGLDVGEERQTYVAGNSLGGLLAVYLAARHPELVKGVVLLNATPFWSFRPSLQAPSQGWWGLMPPGFGSLPVQKNLKSVIERLWWNNLRKPETVRSMLQLVYSHRGSVDEDTVTRILEATEQPMALDVFSAIALAPKPVWSFDEACDRLQAPVLMLYGREDPWVVPLWGQRFKRRVPTATYLELSPAGHCPHHEVPNTVNWAMKRWIEGGHTSPVAQGEAAEVEEEPGRRVGVRNVDAKGAGGPTNFLSRLLDGVWK